MNPFAGAAGDYGVSVGGVVDGLSSSTEPPGVATRKDASTQSISIDKIVSTDPPYYDNIGYADLSDFFYVWLRRSLGPVFPDIFATLAVPKAEELVATPYRHGSREKAEAFFLDGMTVAMQRLATQAHLAFSRHYILRLQAIGEPRRRRNREYWLGDFSWRSSSSRIQHRRNVARTDRTPHRYEGSGQRLSLEYRPHMSPALY